MRRSLLALAFAVTVVALALVTERSMNAACTPLPVASPQGNAGGQFIAVAGAGRYVAFGSYASDLVPGDTSANDFDAFRLDLQTCTVVRAGVTSTGGEANAGVYTPVISDDGRYVAFYTQASNVTPSDFNNAYDVFVRDVQSGTTVRASVSTAGVAGSGHSTVPAISGDGQFVAFWSESPDLVANDNNGEMDVFVRDLINNTTTRVSVASGGVEASGAPGGEATLFFTPSLAISDDGRYVFFASSKTNLVANDTNGKQDIFRHDRQTSTTIRVSLKADGSQGVGDSQGPSASDDGQLVSFMTGEPLISGDTNGNSDIYLRDITQGTTTRISVNGHGGEIPAASSNGSLNGDGRYVAFETAESRLVPGDTGGFTDVFVHDLQTGLTRRVSRSATGVQGNKNSNWGSLSDDGTIVGFFSNATNLVPNSLNLQDVFIAQWQTFAVPTAPDLILNGDFAGGMTSWQTFALPSSSDIVANVVGGVLQFHRPVGSQQAVVLQGTSGSLIASSPLITQFDLGNSSNVNKRVSVLVHDSDFHDLHVCTFWLAANAAMRTYTMRTHTTSVWGGPSISFYAATADGAPSYLVDNVSMVWDTDASDQRSECLDPTTPAAPGGAAGPNLLANGDFSAGQASWGTFGSVTSQVNGGVFEFYRPAQTPAGVVLQTTGQAMSGQQILTATLKLGNSSSVRKRVTLLLHDSNFSSLTACTFWVAPGAPLATYTMRTFAPHAWANATFSLYAATIDSLGWIRLDDATLQRTPGVTLLGTECLEPTVVPSFDRASASTPRRIGAGQPAARLDDTDWVASGRGVNRSFREDHEAWTFQTREAGLELLESQAVDLRDVTHASLTFRSRLRAARSTAEVRVRSGGSTWVTLLALRPTGAWESINIDLRAFIGQVIELQFVYDGADAVAGDAPDAWRIEDPRVNAIP